MDVFGHTRSRLARDHALITPDTHVPSPLIGWKNATSFVHISPEMGARFLQYTAVLDGNAVSHSPGVGIERFFYVQNGSVELEVDSKMLSLKKQTLNAGGFAFIPADCKHQITTNGSGTASLIVFEKAYSKLESVTPPEAIVGDAKDVAGEPFMDDPDAILQTLMPVSPEFDMAVNIFTYQPGATLPQVEIHTMEHGLQMIGGMGVYRLANQYYPVAAGDVIWMASFCPQWFVAMGKQPASYIYYKDIHRDRLSEPS